MRMDVSRWTMGSMEVFEKLFARFENCHFECVGGRVYLVG